MEPLSMRVEWRCITMVNGVQCVINGWDLNDAQVVCSELGLGPAIAARHNASYGQGGGQIWLDNLKCVGTEWTIRMCSHSGWGVKNCSHSKVVGMQCSVPGITYPVYVSIVCITLHIICN